MSSPVVLITGALTGIGRITAVAFAREGARVVVAGRREQEGKKLEKELRDLGAEVEFVKPTFDTTMTSGHSSTRLSRALAAWMLLSIDLRTGISGAGVIGDKAT